MQPTPMPQSYEQLSYPPLGIPTQITVEDLEATTLDAWLSVVDFIDEWEDWRQQGGRQP